LIVDTNGLSAMADGDMQLEPVIQQTGEIAIPVVVLGEYKFGIWQSRKRTRYERWLAEFIPTCRVLVLDEATAEQYAEIRSELKREGHPIPGNDLWIAALARQHAFPVLSRDLHFDFVAGLKRVGW